LWTVGSGKTRCDLVGHTAAVRAVAIDAKGARAASGDDSGAIRLWDLSAGKELSQFHLDGAVSTLAFLEKEKTLAASGGEQGIVLWELSK
jgi:WD40 repeat protein